MIRSILEFLRIAVVLILGNAVVTIAILPFVFLFLYGLVWLVAETFFDPSLLIFTIDIIFMITLFYIFKIPKIEAGWKEFKRQFRGNL